MIKKLTLALVAAAALAAPTIAAPAMANADVVTDWNQTMVDVLEAAKTPPPPSARVGGIVQAAVFDAVNGIDRRYTPVHVLPAAPLGASPAAAAAAAAHEALVVLFPAEATMLDQRLAETVSQISEGTRGDDPSMVRGLEWGKSVADQTLAWRATDGFAVVPPPYTTFASAGRYQLTPPTFSQPLFRQFATMTPFAIGSPSQFLPGPSPALTSAQYARDFNEVKTLGSADSTLRTSDQSNTAIFWQSDTPTAIWNRISDDLAQQRSGPWEEHGGSLLRTARILALMNVAQADAMIAIWNAKNRYDTWRPITAIQQADTDGNPDTIPDITWTPLLTTPPFQEYPAGHPGVSNAAATVLATFYGDHTKFIATSANPTAMAHGFTSFSAAVAEVENARVWGGIHFRTATVVGARMGGEVAAYVTRTHLIPVCGHGQPVDGR